MMAAGFDPARASALLIGSWKCEKHRQIRGEKRYMDSGRRRSRSTVTKKAGIKVKFFKKDGEYVKRDEAEWVAGDLWIMKKLLREKGVVRPKIHNYQEMRKGRFALGKCEVLCKIRKFFKQDSTYFILYFSGHADRDGSWCFSRLTRKEKKKVKESEGATGVGEPGQSSGATANEEDYDIVPRESNSPASSISGDEHVSGESETEQSDLDDTDTEEEASLAKEKKSQLEDAKEWNELIKFEEIIEIWDQYKKESGDERYLMLILDCCYSGQWVRKINGEPEIMVAREDEEEREGGRRVEQQAPAPRRDICAQAACGADEVSMVDEEQVNSTFTKAFADAQNRSLLAKMAFAFLDHAVVLQVASMVVSPARAESFVPLSTENPPFHGFSFFNSFEDMYLKT